MKKTRRNFIKLLIIKTLFLFSFTKSYSDHKLYSKKISAKKEYEASLNEYAYLQFSLIS